MQFSWRDYEPETTLTLPAEPGEPDLAIQIAKVGGGTVGRAYTGQWQAVITYAGREIYRTDDLYTNQACTHQGAARHLADFMSSDRTLDPAVARRLDAWFCET
jgi:hypothetical protein